MIIKTQAIALKIRPFSETSQVVSWLTPDYGKIATIIKGAQRPRNFFLGQYDLFYTCELLFYLRRFQGLQIVKECSPLKPRYPLRTYWPGTACASYFTGLTASITPLHAPHRSAFQLLDTALDFFSIEKNLETGLYWFEMKLLEIMGFKPVLDACLQCRRPLAPENAANQPRPAPAMIAFSAAQGGALCNLCSQKYGQNTARIAPDTLALLRFWQSCRESAALRNVVCSARQIKAVGLVLGGFIQHHLEVENAGRAIALALLHARRNNNQPLKI